MGTRPICTQVMGRETVRSTSSNTSPSTFIHLGWDPPITRPMTCVLYVDGLHSLETSRQQPTAFSARMSLYKEQPSVGHHIAVPPGSRPRRYSRMVFFRRLRVHKSNCASFTFKLPELQAIRSTLAVLYTDTSFFVGSHSTTTAARFAAATTASYKISCQKLALEAISQNSLLISAQ